MTILNNNKPLEIPEDLNKIFNKINNISYGGNLIVISQIKSINCKEWEKEKEFFRSNLLDKSIELKNFWSRYDRRHFRTKNIKRSNEKTATRYYVKDNSKSCLLSHTHEGHIDVRPISNTFSDAFLPLPNKNNFFVTCKKSYKSDDPRKPTIITVPYSTPDDRIALCSPASMWITLSTVTYDLGIEYISLVDVVKKLPVETIGQEVKTTDYSVFSNSLDFDFCYYLGTATKKRWDNAEKILLDKQCDCPIETLFHNLRCKKNEKVMDSEILYAYIESEIPVYLVFKVDDLNQETVYKSYHKSQNITTLKNDDLHAVVAIGHTLSAKGDILNFIIHDVGFAPFIEISKNCVDKKLEDAIVVLPKEIYRYELIKDLFQKILKEIAGSNFEILTLIQESNFIFRPYLMSSQRIKFWFTNEWYPHEIRELFAKAEFPKYAWVFEISNNKQKTESKCLGHIIINADRSVKQTVCCINLPDFQLYYVNKELQKKPFKKRIYTSIPIFKSKEICSEEVIL